MKASDSASQVSFDRLHTHLLGYDSNVPNKIQGLEELRLSTIPETLAQRKKDGDTYLEKTEVTSLVEWKLKHGTYRPNLAKLFASNSVKDVRDITRSALEIYEADNEDYGKSITALSKLKGIGPTTASLLLSCYDPPKVPFFSDELYRYLHWEEAKSKGWDRKINYTIKEYRSLFERVTKLRERLESDSGKQIPAIDIEKAAYVLGKDALPNSRTFSSDAEDADGDKALQPPSPKRRRKATPKSEKSNSNSDIDSDFARIEECRRKGLNGSPTYDTLGFELDKEFIIKHTGGRPRALGKKAMDRLDQKAKESERKAEIIGLPGDSNSLHEQAWDDRVARDLGIAFHEVGIEEYEEWQKKGFTAEKKDFNLSKKERDRLMNLMGGSALRKGSKHR